jgi:single-strand DNA-binding protein
MADDINVLTIAGRLTRDPITKYLPSGTAVCEFSIASNSRVKRGEQWEDKASFFDCTAFGRTAEVIGEYLHKGSQVGIVGRITQDSWEDKETGAKRSKVKIIAEKMQMFGGKPNGGGQSRDEQRQSESGEGSQEPQEQPLKDPFNSGAVAPDGEIPF